jgi:hypothetical protein
MGEALLFHRQYPLAGLAKRLVRSAVNHDLDGGAVLL